MLGTDVSTAHPAIKKILAVTARSDGEWNGKRVQVREVKPGWTYTIYESGGGEARVYAASNVGSRPSAHRVQPPSYGSQVHIGAPLASEGEALVTKQIGRNGSVTIYVPPLDAHVLDVARDALMADDPRQATEVLSQLGPYAGIADAVIRAQSGSLAKATKGAGNRRTSKQLDREIDAFLRRSRG